LNFNTNTNENSKNELRKIRTISYVEKDDDESIKISNTSNSKHSRNIVFQNCFEESWVELFNSSYNKM
jgi:hypothetical protein